MVKTKIELNDVEMDNLFKWVVNCSDVSSTKPRFEIEQQPTGIGIKIVVRELRSAQEQDITDYDCW